MSYQHKIGLGNLIFFFLNLKREPLIDHKTYQYEEVQHFSY